MKEGKKEEEGHVKNFPKCFDLNGHETHTLIAANKRTYKRSEAVSSQTDAAQCLRLHRLPKATPLARESCSALRYIRAWRRSLL